MYYNHTCPHCSSFPTTKLMFIMIVIFSFQVYAQSEQNKRRIGKFTSLEIVSACNTNPPIYPPWLKYPKDTVITDNSVLTIPIYVEFPEFLFNGYIEIDFPNQTPLGTWSRSPSPSRIVLDDSVIIRARVYGMFSCPSDTTTSYNYYGYEVHAYTGVSTLDGSCPDRYKIVSRDTLPAGGNPVDVKAICSFSSFEISAPTYEYDPMSAYWGAGFYFRFRKWFGTDFQFHTSVKVNYTFERVTGPVIGVSNTSLSFTSKPKGNYQSSKITLSNAGTAGSGQLDFSIATSTADGGAWLSVSQTSGSLQPQQSTEFEITVYPSSLSNGTYYGQVTISAPNTVNSPVKISVKLRITEKKLSLKFDPQKIKCSEWTTLEISLVDENDDLVTDFSGGAEVKILKNLSTDKITKLQEFQSVLLTYGKAQPIFIYTPKESFNKDSAITNRTVLSGKLFIEVKLENSTIPADTAKLTVYSPIDFFIDHIEVQQGVKDINKEVTLEYKPDQNRTFPARNFIADHYTFVRAFVDYKKTIDIPFSKMDYKLKGNLQIFLDGYFHGVYEMGKPTLQDEIDSFAVKDTFNIDERINLQDALFTFLSSSEVRFSGSYDFEPKLDLEKLYQYEDEIPNNKKSYSAYLTATRPFRVLAISTRLNEEERQNVYTGIFSFVKDAFPLENNQFQITDPNSYHYGIKNDWRMLSVNYWNILMNILNRQNEQATSGNQYDCILALATDAIMEKFAVSSPGATNSINGKACIIRQSNDNSSQTISHELGHTLGLKETYNVSLEYINPLATLLYTGDPNPKRKNANDVGNWIEEGNIYPYELRQALGSNNYHDIMSGLNFNISFWMDRVTWDYLYNKFVLGTNKISSFQNKNTSNSYIAISGTISESDSIWLNPFIKMTQVPMLDDTLDGDYSVEFYNSGGQLLASYKFNIVFLMPGVQETSLVPFCLYLPFQESSNKILIRKQISGTETKVLAEKSISLNPPQVKIISPVEGDSLTENFIIQWSASDQDGDKLNYDICYSPNDTTSIIIASNLTDTSFVWNAAAYDKCSNGSITVIANDGINDGKAVVGSLTDIKIENRNEVQGKDFVLQQNYPNPFNSRTNISYSIPMRSKVTLKVIDMLGREVAILVNEEKTEGKYKVDFDADKYRLPTGIYFYKLQAGNYSETKKLLLLK